VVVLSPAFFAKNWTEYELDGLLTREMNSSKKIILPVWHSISAEQVASHSPSLAGRVAVNTEAGIQRVVSALIEAMV
jgi:hypothetical protein